MSYLQQPVFLSGLTPVDEPKSVNVATTAALLPPSPPPPQPILIAQTPNPQTIRFVQPRLIQVQPSHAALQQQFTNNSRMEQYFLQPDYHNPGFNEQFNICLPQPINYSNLQQSVKLNPVMVNQNPAQLTHKIYPFTDENKKITNNINIKVETNENCKKYDGKYNTCIGFLTGVLITVILVIAAIIVIIVLKNKIKILDNLATKLVRSKTNCPDGLSGVNCDIHCISTNFTPLIVSMKFQYTTQQNIDDKFLTITEKRSFYGLLIDETTVLIAKHNIIRRFNYSYNNVQYSLNILPNQYHPSFESMYSSLLTPTDTNHKFYYNMFIPNIAQIIENSNADLAVLKLANGFKLFYKDFDINCLFYFKLSIPTTFVEITSSNFYNNTNWIKQTL